MDELNMTRPSPISKPLQNKTALVTGASRGIGSGIAKRLAASGVLVAINYATNLGAAEKTLHAIKDAGGEGFLLQEKLGTPEAASRLAASLNTELESRTGSPQLDILVNSYGGGTYANTAQTTTELYDKAFSDNVGSSFFLTQALLPTLRNQGRVVNLSTAGVRLALDALMVYSMAKASVNTFTIALAKELGPRGITVNAVAPGFIDTDAAAPDLANENTVKYMLENTALGKPYGQPEDIAEVVHSLCLPAMHWVTGQIIECSGGFRL